MRTDLRRIPGVGEVMERDLIALGYTCVASLAGADPEDMYRCECERRGRPTGRRRLYVYRLVVYFAEHPAPDPARLRWWRWKDEEYISRRRKLEALARVARAFRAAGVRWGVGGSLMLYLRGAVESFHDIDLLVRLADAEAARVCLDDLATPRAQAASAGSAALFCSRVFRRYRLDGVEIDMMAGMGVRFAGGAFAPPFEEAREFAEAAGECIPLCALEDWYAFYLLMPGRESRARAIEAFWARGAPADAERLAGVLSLPLPECVRARIQLRMAK